MSTDFTKAQAHHDGSTGPLAGGFHGVMATEQEERTAGMIAHGAPLAAMLFSAGLLGFVGSLVVYLMYKDRGAFAREHAANSLNVQIITGIGLLISLPLMLVLIGFVSFAAVFVAAVVLHVIGLVKAMQGEHWQPPAVPRFVS